ncbi:MAG: glycosyltransferase family 4 protein [Nitrosopumilus sp.]|nr:glycosyltransferase family 4 protein [Nitrosopumilus sp.]
MKIAFICELAGTKRHGGEQYAMLRLADELKLLNNEVDIYSYTTNDSNFKIKSIIPLKFRLLPFVRDIFFISIIGKNLLRKIDGKYDTIVCSSTTISSFYKSKTKLVTICHIIRSQKFNVLSKIPKYKLFFNPITFFLMSSLEQKSLNNSHQVVVIREHQKEFLVKNLKVNSNKITRIPNGVDSNLFKPRLVEKKYHLIFVGRGTILKGLDTLLKSADKIHGKILIVTKLIEPRLLTLAQSKSNIKIIFNASSEELALLYNQSEIFILPSHDEEQPLTVLEAMSSGLPVIVTQKAASDIVKNNINGIIIDNSETKIYSTSSLLIKNKKMMEKMSENNRDKVLKYYSKTKIVSEIQNILL